MTELTDFPGWTEVSEVTGTRSVPRTARVVGAGRLPAGRAAAGPVGPAGRHPRGEAPTSGRPGRARRDLRQSAVAFAVLWLEVERGRRPLRQLRPLLCAELLDRLEQMPRRDGPPSRVVGSTGMRAGEDVYEAVVVLQAGGRVSALCLTLRRRGRCAPWRVTDLGRPEGGALPSPRCGDPDDGDGDCPGRCRPAPPHLLSEPQGGFA